MILHRQEMLTFNKSQAPWQQHTARPKRTSRTAEEEGEVVFPATAHLTEEQRPIFLGLAESARLCCPMAVVHGMLRASACCESVLGHATI